MRAEYERYLMPYLAGLSATALVYLAGSFLKVSGQSAAEMIDFPIVDGGELGAADVIAGDDALGVVDIHRGLCGGTGVRPWD